MKTWIKFCGTTSVEDALAALEAGADALGFIFAPSKRQVTVADAGTIIRALPADGERIGVFVNETPEEIADCVSAAGLTGVQLHAGGPAPDAVKRLASSGHDSLRIIRTVVVKEGAANLEEADFSAPGEAGAWLLDSGAGSGRTFDWRAARARLGGRQGRFIIAGGLDPGNVGQAIEIFRPWGVDVVSGIERAPGRKDPEKMRAFVAAVRKAEHP